MHSAFRALLGAATLASLAACAGKVDLGPREPFIGAGLYRSRLIAEEGGPSYRLELMSSGRFNLRTFAEGCQVGEETGHWRNVQDTLELDVHHTRGRDGCAGSWVSAPRRERFLCRLRQVTGSSFQMLHDEIGQGARWTEWKRSAMPSVASAADDTKSRPGSPAIDLASDSDLEF